MESPSASTLRCARCFRRVEARKGVPPNLIGGSPSASTLRCARCFRRVEARKGVPPNLIGGSPSASALRCARCFRRVEARKGVPPNLIGGSPSASTLRCARCFRKWKPERAFHRTSSADRLCLALMQAVRLFALPGIAGRHGGSSEGVFEPPSAWRVSERRVGREAQGEREIVMGPVNPSPRERVRQGRWTPGFKRSRSAKRRNRNKRRSVQRSGAFGYFLPEKSTTPQGRGRPA